LFSSQTPVNLNRLGDFDTHLENQIDGILFEVKMEEIWKPVLDWKYRYEVSNLGNVKRVLSTNSTFSGRLLKVNSDQKYIRVRLCANGNDETRSVHSLVLEAFVCRRPKGMVANHKNGNKHDNRLDNLEWVTPSENTQHGFDVLHRNTPRGEKHGMAKLSSSKANEIKELYNTGAYGQWALARLFNIGRSTIQRVVSGKCWRNDV